MTMFASWMSVGFAALAAAGSAYDPKREERERIQVAVTRRKLTENQSR